MFKTQKQSLSKIIRRYPISCATFKAFTAAQASLMFLSITSSILMAAPPQTKPSLSLIITPIPPFFPSPSNAPSKFTLCKPIGGGIHRFFVGNTVGFDIIAWSKSGSSFSFRSFSGIKLPFLADHNAHRMVSSRS
ncbi:hypothetical protein V6Z12_A01G142900 [Gossypium hirsutum]